MATDAERYETDEAMKAAVARLKRDARAGYAYDPAEEKRNMSPAYLRRLRKLGERRRKR
jgi:hypothetical protein